MIAVMLSIFLIYLMLAAQFENLVQPIIILAAVPFCISGVAVFLVLFGLNVSALVFVGFIILVGVSVNTSIVMVDFANQMVAEGRSVEEAIAEATVRRMRPILVTTLSGILGLVPMAFAIGPGAAMQQPLAVTMIGGHISSTILTVLVVPIIYTRLAKAAKLETPHAKA
jgi:HAE1 family hydrophobic/amphiphilic exporter-1